MIIEPMSWLYAGIGGVLIGIASLILLLFNGRIAGISGITGTMLLKPAGDTLWRMLFVLGMVLGGVVLLFAYPQAFPSAEGSTRSTGALVLAGVLVGVGTRMGSGCTSGHGVCGMSRLSPRSFAATGTFMLIGGIVVAIITHAFGGTV